MNKDFSILVSSFDGYSDVWDYFFQTKDKFWPECPYKIRLVSNFKSYSACEVIRTGPEVSWSDRMLKAIEFVPEKYVMLLLEDYLFASEVKVDSIEEALSFMKQNSVEYLRIVNIPQSRYNPNNQKFYQIYDSEEYGVNLQASIWDKSRLVEFLQKYSGSAWNFEIGLLSETVNAKGIPIPNCFGVTPDLIDFKNGILKGKWFPSTIRYYKKLGIRIDYSSRGMLSFWNNARYNLMVFIKNNVSYNTRKRLKKVFSYLGVKFISKY